MKFFIAIAFLCFAFANARIYTTIDTFLESSPPVTLIVGNGGDPVDDRIWYTPYYGINNEAPRAFLFRETANALGGQRDSILGYEGTTPENAVAVLSIVSRAASVAFPLEYNGGAYFQWDGIDAAEGDASPFPGSTLNSSPGIGSGPLHQGLIDSGDLIAGTGAGTLDFTFGNRATGITINISADHEVEYRMRAIDSVGNINTLIFNVDTANEDDRFFFFHRFDSPEWSFPGFNFNDVAGFEVIVFTFEGTATNNAIDTDFRFLHIFGFVISGNVVVDCTCDDTESTPVNGEVITMEGTDNAVSLTTTTDVTGYYQFDSATIVVGSYNVCIQDTTLDLCPTFPNRCYPITISTLSTEDIDNADVDFSNLDFHITVDSTLAIPDDVIVPCGSCTTVGVGCQESATISGCGSTSIEIPTSFTDTQTISGCDVIISRRWFNPENTSQFGVQTITVRDDEAPVISPQASSRTIRCDEPSTYTNFISTQAGADATDCTTFSWSASINSAPIDCDFETVTFTATDACGNFDSTTATYTVTDDVAPVFTTLPESDEAECDLKSGSSNNALNQWNALRANSVVVDDCSPSGSLDFDSTFVGFLSDCDNSESVTYTVTDRCGNFVQAVASFRIFDNTPPSISTQPRDLNLDCSQSGGNQFQDWLDSNGGAVATDLCIADDADLVWTNDNNGSGLNSCADNGSVTFIVQDACGFTNAATASYALTDNTPPQITNQASNLAVQCDGTGNTVDFNNWVATNAGATATDACGNVFFTSNATVGPSDCGDVVNVVFTATDDCSNLTATTSANFSIVDTEAPFFVQTPVSQTAECNTNAAATFDAWLASAGGASIGDDCNSSGLFISNDFTSTFNLFCNNVISVRFFANDPCGNVSPAQTATFTVVDTIAPVINPTATSVAEECNLTSAQSSYTTFLSTRGGAEATDSCGSITWTNNGPATVAAGCDESAIVTFTATDNCGNLSETIASFSISDTTAPTLISEAQDRSVECTSNGNTNDLNNWLASNGGASASDSCGAVTFTNNFTALSGGCVSAATVTFTGCDSCGLCVSTSGTFTVSDTRAPTINPQAQNRIVECDPTSNTNAFQDYLNDNGGARASDDCNPDSLVFSSSFVSSPSGCDSETVTFTVTDACGQTAVTTASFQILDSVAPAFSVLPTDEVVECDGAGNTGDYNSWVSSNAGSVATDACAIFLTTTNNAAVAGPIGCGTQVVAFTVEDECNNSITRTATFRVQDTIAPSFSPAPSDRIVECDATTNLLDLNNWLDDNANSSVFDSCYGTNVSITNNFVALTPDLCGSSADVLFRATDPCGQTTEATATFTVVDTTAPQITNQATTESFECSAANNSAQIAAYVANRGGATASDACTGVIWTNNFSVDPVECSGPVAITFTATDACGNASVTIGSVSIDDTVAPVFVAFPADITIGCDSDSDPSVTGTPGASDACDGTLEPAFSDSSFNLPDEGFCPGDLVTTRVWTIVDDCGNFHSSEQIITTQLARATGPCSPTECPSCEVDQCCEVVPEQVACNSVACNAVSCTAVSCSAVPCIPAACEDDDDYVLIVDDDDLLPPIVPPTPAPAVECNPVFIYVFDDDEGEPVDNEFVAREAGSSSSSASTISAGFLFFAMTVVALLF